MPPRDQSLLPQKILLHVIFFLSGIATVLIGQVLPLLSDKFKLDDLEAGYLFPAQFAGSVAGTFLTSSLGKRGMFLFATVVGCGLMAAGMLIMNSPTYTGCVVGFAINGLGIGLTLPSINMLILEMDPRHPASALNILNFCWGAGAIISKPFVDILGGTSVYYPSVALAVPLLVCGVLLAGVSGGPTPRIAYPAGEDVRIAIWSTPLAWVLAFFNFIHIGFESGMGGWLTTYAARMELGVPTGIISPTLLYFLFFVIGRGVAPMFFRFLSENKVIMMNLIIISVGMLFTLTADGTIMLAIGASIAGFGSSSIFPTSVSRFGRVFGPEATRRATPLFICGTLGAALVTWLIGYLSDVTSDLHYGMFVIGASTVILILLQIGLMYRGVGDVRSEVKGP